MTDSLQPVLPEVFSAARVRQPSDSVRRTAVIAGLLTVLTATLIELVTAEAMAHPALQSRESAEVPDAPPMSTAATGRKLTPLSREATEAIRELCLAVLPERFDESDNWGNETRIQSGLDVRLDGLRVRTNRRWNSVNHGTWQKVTVKLIDPQNTFQLSVFQIEDDSDGPRRQLITSAARLRVVGQIQQWNLGVMLWSVSAEATADISFQTEFVMTHQLRHTDEGLRLRLQPTVNQSRVRLDGFSLRRIGQWKGAAIRETGGLIEPLLIRRLEKENRSLDETINRQLNRKADRLELPFDVFSSLFDVK